MDAALNGPRPRVALIVTALAPVVPQLLGSAFNIWYNLSVIEPLLGTETLKARFLQTVIIYNVCVYPVAMFAWLRRVLSIGPVLRQLHSGEKPNPDGLMRARRRAINLPWSIMVISGVAWFLCVPVFLISLTAGPDAFDPRLFWHLPISFLVSGFIAITHSFFLVELASHWGIFPTLFRAARADLTPGGRALSLKGRGLLWAISAGICPIGSLLLLSFAPPAPGTDPAWFAVFVGTVGVAFGLCTALLIGRLVSEPIDQLRSAAQGVSEGRLDRNLHLPRADEFGLLIAEFNHMLHELREKERLRQTFGLHVGRRTAEQILARDPGLGGVEQVITIMFVDIRSFTQRTATLPPAEAVRMLNSFLRVMVHVVETRHTGIINKFLGDGFMALFGIGVNGENHADEALATGRDMLAALEELNATLVREGREQMAIGIGIHTGPAIVGSIGSPERLEFTAIGSAVNIASRIEALTKTVKRPLLLTEGTARHLKDRSNLEGFPPQAVRGVEEPVRVFSIGSSGSGTTSAG
ncbi:MAG TPA: adenylate/guanylate cyclase domain-containing protein [Chthoniobacterales bacterium]|nr:adenylate/guanylate cyclase domain-containing protein [Chthoniobacterales bacterium]